MDNFVGGLDRDDGIVGIEAEPATRFWLKGRSPRECRTAKRNTRDATHSELGFSGRSNSPLPTTLSCLLPGPTGVW